MIGFKNLFGVSIGFDVNQVTDYSFAENEKVIKYHLSFQLFFWSFEVPLLAITQILDEDDWVKYKKMKGEIDND